MRFYIASVSNSSVTGPSLTDATSMSAPNSPCCGGKPASAQKPRNFSYRSRARSGAAAWEKPGRRLLRSAYSVNWETTRSDPWTCSRLLFILPFSSSNTRRRQILSASFRAVSSVSPGPTPSRTKKPCPICPFTLPPMVTEASFTLVTTARIRHAPFLGMCRVYDCLSETSITQRRDSCYNFYANGCIAKERYDV